MIKWKTEVENGYVVGIIWWNNTTEEASKLNLHERHSNQSFRNQIKEYVFNLQHINSFILLLIRPFTGQLLSSSSLIPKN